MKFELLGQQQQFPSVQEAWTLHAAGVLPMWLPQQIHEPGGEMAGRPEQCGELFARQIRHFEILQKGQKGGKSSKKTKILKICRCIRTSRSPTLWSTPIWPGLTIGVARTAWIATTNSQCAHSDALVLLWKIFRSIVRVFWWVRVFWLFGFASKQFFFEI